LNLAARRRLRLRTRDLAAASAYSAVGLSGAVPLWVTALFGLSFVLAMLGYRPLARLRAGAVIILLAVALLLFGLAFRGVIDLVVAAVSFASLVTAHRMLSAPEASTDRQVLLASLLLIAGAAALAGEIWYAACLLFFGVFACLALGLAVIEGPVERDEELPLWPVLRQISIGVAFALMGGIAFFFLFPRLSWNMAARRATPPLLGGTTGMTDRVRLGGGGTIKTSARVVLRAALEPDPHTQRLERYWVGRHFDVFDGKEWRGSGVELPPAPHVLVEPASGRQLVQRIELLPAYDSRTLVAIARPASFGSAVAISTSGTAAAMLVKVEGEEVHFALDANAYRYTATSHEADAPPQKLPNAQRERALALPASLDVRIGQLAASVTGTETDPEQIARRLEQWLKRNFAYTLDLPGDVDDPLTDFLFARKEGHCEHFATALAVMLRTRGVPARVVGGFFGGERIGERYVVRAGDAHAWVEAWIEGKGWLLLDATPESGRGSQPTALMARLVDVYERLEELWRSRVVDYSLLDQVGFVRNLIRPPREQAHDVDSPEGGSHGSLPVRRLAAALAAGLVTFWVWRRVSRRLERRTHPAVAFLDEIERCLTRANILRQEGELLEELAARLSAAKHPAAPIVSRTTRRYLEARFGRRPLRPGERKALLKALERGLSSTHTSHEKPGAC
jgi:transglutaminase-like putative cysteine protease